MAVPIAKSLHSFTLSAFVAVAVLAGTGLGIGSYTFFYAKGWSYFTNNPAACANCHIMQTHYDAWVKSSHRAVATCNDCHTPPDLIGKYYTKADHGFWHSYAFTTGDFHEPIFMKARSRAIVQASCRRCHGQIVEAIESPDPHRGLMDCLRCHGTVGHPM
jgi:cytochrome c nitrite reductase small subunit